MHVYEQEDKYKASVPSCCPFGLEWMIISTYLKVYLWVNDIVWYPAMLSLKRHCCHGGRSTEDANLYVLNEVVQDPLQVHYT